MVMSMAPVQSTILQPARRASPMMSSAPGSTAGISTFSESSSASSISRSSESPSYER